MRALTMSSDARTLSLRDTLLDRARTPRPRRLSPARVKDDSRAVGGSRAAALALATIVLLTLLIVLLAANRPSSLAATSHPNYFPRWMAGSLGGLVPEFTRNPSTLRALFSIAMALMYVSWMLAIRYASLLRLRWVLLALATVHAVLLLSPPFALTDVFNYINYARMEIVHHLNPYATIPALEPHGDPTYYLSNWHQLPSPYGPLFTLLTFAVVPLGVAGAFWAMKAIIVSASLGIALLVWRCAKLLGREPAQALVFASLNPIVLVWGLAGVHNDFLMVLLLMIGFFLLLKAGRRAQGAGGGELRSGDGQLRSGDGGLRSGDWQLRSGDGELRKSRASRVRARARELPLQEVLAGIAFAAAVADKASAVIIVPVVIAGLIHHKRRVLALLGGLIAGGIVLALCSYLAFGAHLPDLSAESSLVTALSPPNLLGLALGQGGVTHAVRVLVDAGLAIAVALSGVGAWRARSSITAAGWASLALIVTLTWVLPWYVSWVLPFAALSKSRRLRAGTLILGAYIVLTWAPLFTDGLGAVGFRPSGTPVGKTNQIIVKEYLR